MQLQRLHVVMVAGALAAASLLTTGPASATLMDSIDALNPGEMYRVVFMTFERGKAEDTDIVVYNDRVIAAAILGSVTSPLSLSWSALASTAAVNAQANTGVLNSDFTPVSFFNTNGDRIATSGADLWSGSLSIPIQYDENGSGTGNENAEGEFFTWTGTDEAGATLDPLGPPPVGENAGAARFADANATNSQWMSKSTNPSDFQRSLYGVSEKVTVVPEPSTALLLGSGLGLVGLVRRRACP
jgi:hypothetical protein